MLKTLKFIRYMYQNHILKLLELSIKQALEKMVGISDR